MSNFIGGGADQVPTNGMLGTAAFMDAANLPTTATVQAALDGKQATLPSGSLGLKLVTSITPTAATAQDFLTAFSSSYDNYLIVGTGINFAADDGISLRLAKSGAADTASNYMQTTFNGGESTTATSSITVTSGNVRSAGRGANFYILVQNVNNASTAKVVTVSSVWNSTVAGPGYTSIQYQNVYFSADVVTGFRLYSSISANFAAQGSIRVYGYSNT